MLILFPPTDDKSVPSLKKKKKRNEKREREGEREREGGGGHVSFISIPYASNDKSV